MKPLTVSRRRLLLGGVIAALLVMLLPVACTRILTRFEDQVTVTRVSDRGKEPYWRLEWRTLARRGVNLVDSSGNVGSASATFRCVAHPTLPLTWTVSGKAMTWEGSGDASDVLGSPATGDWRGTVTLVPTADGKAMILDLHDNEGRAFVGNRRYDQANGNGETWIAQ